MSVSENYSFIEISAVSPKSLSKTFVWNDLEQKLETTGGGKLYEGTATVFSERRPEAFLSRLKTATSRSCFMYGVPRNPKAGTFEIWQKMKIEQTLQEGKTPASKNGVPVMSRTKENFVWPKTGIFMLDYDPLPGSPVLPPNKILDSIFKVAPLLSETPYIVQPSNSSYLSLKVPGSGKETETFIALKGLRGTHFYFFVNDMEMADISGQNLFDRLWISGEGRFILSESGSLLPRTVIDRSVWQPSRLDFGGAPNCVPPVFRQAPEPTLFHAEKSFVSLTKALPDLTKDEKNALAQIVSTQKKVMEKPSMEKKQRWIEVRLKEARETAPISPEVSQKGDLPIFSQSPPRSSSRPTEKTFRQAVESGILSADFPIILSDKTRVTVGEILSNPERYDKKTCKDPLEPGYRGGRDTGWIALSGKTPIIYSQAHGGAKYLLSNERDIQKNQEPFSGIKKKEQNKEGADCDRQL